MATIITRAGKGSPLTFAEADGNFTNLNTDKLEAPGGIVNQPVTFQDTVDFENQVNISGGPLVVSNSLLSGLPSIEVGAPIGSHRIKITSQSGVNGGSGVEFDGGADHYIGHGGLSYGSNDLAIVTNLGTSGTNNLRWYNFNTELMRLTSTGQLGIGVTSPSSPLHVSGEARLGLTTNIVRLNSSAAVGILEFNSTAGTIKSNSAGSALTFETSGANERMRIDSSGRLLLGTSTTRIGFANLLIQETINSSSGFSLVRNTADALGAPINFLKTRGTAVGAVDSVVNSDVLGVISWNAANGTTTTESSRISSEVDAAPSAGNVPGRIRFLTREPAGSLIERLRIDSSGNVGIGTTPTEKLDLSGAMRLSDSSGNQTIYQASTVGRILITSNTSTGLDAASIRLAGSTNVTNPSGIQFYSGGAFERMRIDSTGNVGIGTTSFGTSAVRTLAVANGTEPSAAVADTIQMGSVDLTAGNTIPYVRAEGTGITGAGITSTTVTHKIAIKVNGTVYYLLATTNGT